MAFMIHLRHPRNDSSGRQRIAILQSLPKNFAADSSPFVDCSNKVSRAGEGISSQHHFPRKGILVRKPVLLPIVAVCGIAAANSASDPGARTLSHQQLVEQVVGNTIHFQGPDFEVFEYLSPDGVTVGISNTDGRYRKGDILGFSTKAGPYRARWRIIRGNLLCLEHDDPMQSGCVTIVLEPGKIEFHRLDGVVEGPFEFLHGNPRKLD